MLLLTAERVRALAPLPLLIECLHKAFSGSYAVPLRQVAQVPGGGGARLFFSMPAFDPEGGGVVKLVTSFPDNEAAGLPTVQAVIVVFSAAGEALAILDGTVVTQLRTGAASALASTYLSRADSAHLAVIGTGALAPTMAAAHSTVRPIKQISVCGRTHERASHTAAAIRSLVNADVEVRVASSTEAAVGAADIVCCATSSATPVLRGQWLKAGTFVDLVGAFTPSRREADDAVMLRARIFVDTFAGALAEARYSRAARARRYCSRARRGGACGSGLRPGTRARQRRGNHCVQVGWHRDRGSRSGTSGGCRCAGRGRSVTTPTDATLQFRNAAVKRADGGAARCSRL